jgi:hypothetical protein
MAGEDEDYGSARITIDLDDADAVADARDLGLRIQRALVRATRTTGDAIRRNIQRGLSAASVSVRVEPDMSRFDARLLDGLRSFDSINLPVAPDLTGFVERIRALLAGEEVSIRVVPDLTDFDARIRAHSAPRVTVGIDLDNDGLVRALSGIGRAAGGVVGAIGGLLRIGTIGILAASAAQGLLAFGAALAPAAGLLAAGPAVILGYQAALGGLRLALMGVGDAFSAALTGDAEEFEESLEDLSPKAQAAAREVRALKPAFEELRNSVQDAFFAQIEGQITSTADALSGPLKSGLTAISNAWGAAAKGALGYVQGAQGVANIRSILTGAQAATEGFASTTNRLTAGLLQVAAVVSDRFGAELESGISNLGERFGTFLQKAAQGGDAVRWVDQAITALAQLGDLLGNIGSIFSGVFRAANADGAGFLSNLQTITQSVSEFVNSDAGQSALGNIFRTISEVAAQAGPIVAALLSNLGQIAPSLAPIFQQLGPVIVQTINQLGAAVQGALPHLAVIFADLGAAALSLGPALPPVAEAAAALARSAADLVVALAPAVTLFAQILGPVISYGAPVLVAAAATLALAKAFRAIQAAILLVRGAWVALTVAFAASPLGVIALAVIGLVTAVYLLYQRFGAVRAVVDAVGRALRDGFLAAVGFVQEAAGQIGDFFVGAFEDGKAAVSAGVDAVVDTASGIATRITEGLSSLGSSLGAFFTSAWETGKAAFQAGVDGVVSFVTSLPQRIWEGLQALPGLLLDAFTSAVAYLIIGLAVILAGVVYAFTELPLKIYNGLLSLGSVLISAFTSAFTAATATVSGWITSTADFVRQLPTRAGAALSGLTAAVVGKLQAAFAAGKAAVSAFVTAAASFVQQLPTRAGAALSGLTAAVVGKLQAAFAAGKAAVSAFVTAAASFVRQLPTRAGQALSSLGSSIGGAISRAAGRARAAASGLITGVVSLFADMPRRILGAIGDIGSQIVRKVKAGIPSGISKYLPFADGGIVYGPTHALIGEAGPEVVIPLTKPKRAAALAARSGLLDMLGVTQARTLAAAGTSGGGAAAASAVKSLRQALIGLGTLLDNVGRDVVLGMVEGIRDNAGMVVAAAAEMADGAAVGARKVLDIHSPSKIFAQIGRDTGRGFVEGLTGTEAQIKATGEKVVKGIIKAFEKLKASKTDDWLIYFIDRSNQNLRKLARERDAIAKRIQEATKFAADTTKAALDSFSLSRLTQGQETVTTKGLTKSLEDAVTRMRNFRADLDKLARRGLSKDLLAQIIGMGPDQGAQLADTLANSTRDSLKRLNTLQGQLSKESTALGRTSADVLFDAGANAGKGFLAGLKAEQKAIERYMTEIAKRVAKTIRDVLKIRSPSRVMRYLGSMTGAGLRLGLLGELAALQKTSASAARRVADGVSAELSAMGSEVIPLTRLQRARQAAAGAGGGAGRRDGGTTVINNNVTIREVGDGRVTAQRVINRIAFEAGVMG